jgi:3-oxocholest-4-en-26-oyl-CoA dehydrogenase beta subunit
MDFTFDEVQEDLRGLAARILSERVTPERLKDLEAGADRIDREVWRAFADANLLGISLPERWGGSGYGIMETAVLLEEVGRAVAPIPLLATVVMGALPVAEHGTDDQRQRLLPGVVDGTTFLSAALQEPLGTDPLEPAASAQPDGDRWRVTGEKVAVPWGMLADEILIGARTPDGATGLFLVPGDADGVERAPAESTNLEPQAHLVLRGASAERVGGDDALAWLYRRTLAGLCATAVGVLDRAVHITAGYISQREQFGKPLATFQGAAIRTADAYIDTRAATVTTWSAIWRLDEGRPADDELAIAKFWVADGGHRVVHACQHLHGGMGVDVDYPIHRYTQWAKALEHTLGGSTQQLLRIGESLAGASVATAATGQGV